MRESCLVSILVDDIGVVGVMLHCGYHGGAVSVLVDVTTDATGVTSSALWCK